MAAYNGMGEIPLRNELERRGLLVDGTVNQLRQRLVADDALGVFHGYLGSMSETDLEDACRRRSIPIPILIKDHEGDHRQKLFKSLKRYNKRKGGVQANRELCAGWLNTGLPTPEDRLGPPTGQPPLGTPGSGLVFPPYIDYLEAHREKNGTIDDALTFRCWRICVNPGIPLRRLWRILYLFWDDTS